MVRTAWESDIFSAHEVSSSRTGTRVDVPDQSGNSRGAFANGITVPDAALLFSGDYKRSGEDLIISGTSHKITIGNYFSGEHHRALFSSEGASLSGNVVDALIALSDSIAILRVSMMVVPSASSV